MERDKLNLDKLGLRLTKPAPRLFDVALRDYQHAAEWVRAFVSEDVCGVVLDPYVERWLFYDGAGEFLFALPHDLMERVNNAVCQRSTATIHARQTSRDREGVGEAYGDWGALAGENDGA